MRPLFPEGRVSLKQGEALKSEYAWQGDGQSIKFRSSNTKGVEPLLRSRLSRALTLEGLQNLHEESGFTVPLCNVCGKAFPPFKYELVFSPGPEGVVTDLRIVGFTLKRRFLYCYGVSDHCGSWAKGSGKRNPNSAEFISAVLKISKEEALGWIKKNNSSPFYEGNNPSTEDYKSFQSRGLKYHVAKFGQVEGTARFQEVISRANFARSRKGFIARHGEEGALLYEKGAALKDSMSEKAVRRLHPTISPADLEARIQERREGVGLTQEEYVKKHGPEKGAILREKKSAASRGRTNAKFRAEFGEEAFKRLQERRRVNQKCTTTSGWASRMIDSILRKVLFSEDLILKYGWNEFKIYDPAKTRNFFYDLYVEFPSGRKAVVELNGTYYHAPPWLTDAQRQKWRKLGSRDSWEKSREFDLYKQGILLAQGIELLVVWDNERVADICNKVREFLHG